MADGDRDVWLREERLNCPGFPKGATNRVCCVEESNREVTHHHGWTMQNGGVHFFARCIVCDKELQILENCRHTDKEVECHRFGWKKSMPAIEGGTRLLVIAPEKSGKTAFLQSLVVYSDKWFCAVASIHSHPRISCQKSVTTRQMMMDTNPHHYLKQADVLLLDDFCAHGRYVQDCCLKAMARKELCVVATSSFEPTQQLLKRLRKLEFVIVRVHPGGHVEFLFQHG